MLAMNSDLFYQFTDFYENGQFLKALQSLINHPDIIYDTLSSDITPFQHLINYADACVFMGDLDSQFVREALIGVFETDERLKIISKEFISILKIEQILQAHFTFTNESQINDIENIPEFYRSLVEHKVHILENCNRLIRSKPSLAHFINKLKEAPGLPWHKFSYDIQVEPITLTEGAVPLIFMESLQEFDYESFLNSFRGHQAIFIFETSAMFFQLLHWDVVVTALEDPLAIIYILEIYPEEQFKIQNCEWDQSKSLKPILMVDRPMLRELMPTLTDVLQKNLCQNEEKDKNETATSNWLYSLTQRLLFRIQTERYGESRCLALNLKQDMKKWHDPHKGFPPSQAYLGHLPTDFIGKLVETATEKRIAKSLKRRPKLRIAHVVAQIVDGGHAPSKLVKVLLEYSDRSLFDRFLIVTEQLIYYPLEYPIAPYSSESSKIRGKETLHFLQENGVQIMVTDPAKSYLKTSQNTSDILSALEFDLIIFHGPDVINCLCSASVNAPIRIMFDHGTLPSYPCFDFVIISSEDSYIRNHIQLKQIGMESAPLHFSLDVRKQWGPVPYSKKELGFPEDSFLMTTISHHLDSRLSTEMCHAIGEILQRCPKAFYAPIGPVTQEEKFRTIFESYGVNNRVVFLGNKKNPSHYMRSMELYLNEFPFGSGISIFDGMAAGCPVVTMYDEEGPPQARYGGIYFGMEHSITSGRKSDYVDLACSLFSNKELYGELSKHALKQFEKYVDEKAYVKNFEKILKQICDRKSNEINI